MAGGALFPLRCKTDSRRILTQLFLRRTLTRVDLPAQPGVPADFSVSRSGQGGEFFLSPGGEGIAGSAITRRISGGIPGHTRHGQIFSARAAFPGAVPTRSMSVSPL